MGNSSSASSSRRAEQWEEYRRRLAEWEETVAAQEAEEAAERYRSYPGPCALTTFWLQQCCGMLVEIPLREVWHGLFVPAAAGCCLVPGVCMVSFGGWTGCLPVASCGEGCGAFGASLVSHHTFRMEQYALFWQYLLHNLRTPCEPHYFFSPDVALTRPEKPTPPPENASSSSSLDCNCATATAAAHHDPLHCCDDACSSAVAAARWTRAAGPREPPPPGDALRAVAARGLPARLLAVAVLLGLLRRALRPLGLGAPWGSSGARGLPRGPRRRRLPLRLQPHSAGRCVASIRVASSSSSSSCRSSTTPWTARRTFRHPGLLGRAAIGAFGAAAGAASGRATQLAARLLGQQRQ